MDRPLAKPLITRSPECGRIEAGKARPDRQPCWLIPRSLERGPVEAEILFELVVLGYYEKHRARLDRSMKKILAILMAAIAGAVYCAVLLAVVLAGYFVWQLHPWVPTG